MYLQYYLVSDQALSLTNISTRYPGMSTSRSEDVMGEKWDRCLADSSVKILGGLTVGTVLSLVLFKRKLWPVNFGLGAGFGMGYSNCEYDLNNPYMVHVQNLKKLKE